MRTLSQVAEEDGVEVEKQRNGFKVEGNIFAKNRARCGTVRGAGGVAKPKGVG
jgi:hypothetical protein